MDRRVFLQTLAGVAGLAGTARAFRGGPGVAPDRLTLAAVGDCILARRVMENRDPDFLALVDLLQGVDATWGNFELVEVGPQNPDPLSSWPVQELRALGLRLVGTANNHSLDSGEEGLLATLENLDRAGIAHAGAGADLDQASRSGVCETWAGRIAEVNCASTFPDCFAASSGRLRFKGRPGLNPLHLDLTVQVGRDLFSRLKEVEAKLADLEGDGEIRALLDEPASPGAGAVANVERTTFQAGDRIEALAAARPGDVRRITQSIHAARPGSRLVIASLHAHEARTVLERPAPFLRPFAHACLDAGADLFLSAGPHVLRGIEVYQGKPIFYSLGNFLFQYFGERVAYHRQARFWQSVVPRLTYEGEHLAAVDLHPIALGFGLPVDRRGTPRLARGEEARQILNRLAELSRPFGTVITIEGEIGKVRLG